MVQEKQLEILRMLDTGQIDASQKGERVQLYFG